MIESLGELSQEFRVMGIVLPTFSALVVGVLYGPKMIKNYGPKVRDQYRRIVHRGITEEKPETYHTLE